MSKRFQATDAQRVTVALHAVAGTPQEIMCQVIINPMTGKPISKNTLEKVFRKELDTGLATMISKAVGVLANRLNKNDLGAACFVLKTRAGWSERPEGVGLDEEKLARRIIELGQQARANV